MRVRGLDGCVKISRETSLPARTLARSFGASDPPRKAVEATSSGATTFLWRLASNQARSIKCAKEQGEASSAFQAWLVLAVVMIAVMLHHLRVRAKRRS